MDLGLVTSNELPINAEIEIEWASLDYPYFEEQTLTLDCPAQWYCGFETSGIQASMDNTPQIILTNGIHEPTFPLIPADTQLNLILGPFMFPLG